MCGASSLRCPSGCDAPTGPDVRVGFEVIAAGTGFEEGGGGAAGYIEGLLPRVADDPRVEAVVAYAANWYPGRLGAGHPKIEVRRSPIPKAQPPRVAFEQFGVPAWAARDGIDVLFSTGNYRPLVYRRANVVALHAGQHFILGGDIGSLRSAYLKFAVPRSVRTADLTIAVTETLRRDAIRLFGLDPDRVVSVHMGPPPWVAELSDSGRPADEPYRPPDGSPYILCISRLYALKNHHRLIEAFAHLVHEHSLPHVLVIVGGDADVTREQLAAAAREAGVADRVLLLGRMPQADVPG